MSEQKQNNILLCHQSIHKMHKWLDPFIDKSKANVYYIDSNIFESDRKKLSEFDIITNFNKQDSISYFEKNKLLNKINNIVSVYCPYQILIEEDKSTPGKYNLSKQHMENVYKLLKPGGKYFVDSFGTFLHDICKNNFVGVSPRSDINDDPLLSNLSNAQLESEWKIKTMKDNKDIIYQDTLSENGGVDVFIKKYNFYNYYKADPYSDQFNMNYIIDKLMKPFTNIFRVINYTPFNIDCIKSELNIEHSIIIEKI